jgi:hypothetical protein
MNHSGDGLAGFPIETATAWVHTKQEALPRLAIVGSHSDKRDLIPWDDDVEIWVFNEAPQKDWCKRWDATFQLHRPEVYTSPDNYHQRDHWDWLQKQHGKRIFMQHVDERVPDCVAYPLEGVLQLIPYRYLRSSPAFALALAIYLGYQQIGLYNMALTSNTEYAYQATNMAFWIGFAHGRGIDLQLHCWQDEFDQRLYGFEGELQIEREFFAERAASLETTWKEANRNLERLKRDLEQAMEKAQFDRVSNLIGVYEKAALETGEAAGALGEAKRYFEHAGDVPRQEFEYAVAKAQRDGEQARVLMFHAGGKAEYVWNVWRQTGVLQALNQLRQFTREVGQRGYDTGALMGIYQENLRYMAEYDQRIGAAGGVKALQAVGKGS